MLGQHECIQGRCMSERRRPAYAVWSSRWVAALGQRHHKKTWATCPPILLVQQVWALPAGGSGAVQLACKVTWLRYSMACCSAVSVALGCVDVRKGIMRSEKVLMIPRAWQVQALAGACRRYHQLPGRLTGAHAVPGASNVERQGACCPQVPPGAKFMTCWARQHGPCHHAQ